MLSLRFRALHPGAASLTVASALVLANDGQGTQLPISTAEGHYAIVERYQAAPATPTITSSTHPDPQTWYASDRAAFSWVLPPGVSGVSYAFNTDAEYDPGTTSVGLLNTAFFQSIPEGISYFHIRFRSGNAWDAPVHIPVRTDTQTPRPFTIQKIPNISQGNDAAFRFSTEDTGSGILQYRIRVDAGEWRSIAADDIHESFVVSGLDIGRHELLVEAVDRAGNATRAATVFSIATTPSKPFPLGLSLLVLGVFLLGATVGPTLLRRTKKFLKGQVHHGLNGPLRFILAVGGTELVGVMAGMLTRTSVLGWYSGLILPELSPPRWVFGPVWAVLYALVGIALFFLWSSYNVEKVEKKRSTLRIALLLFGVQLSLNLFWVLLFFGLQLPVLALAEIVLLWLAIGATIIVCVRTAPRAAWLLVPYLLWVSFAGYLNYAIVVLN